jgi:MFS transporter, DHA2 family, multidrug resistance protein
MARSEVMQSGPISIGDQSHRPLFAVVAVLLGSLLANVDTRLFSIGLADLRGAYSLSFDEGAWLSTATTASQIAVAPAVAWLATAFGLRRVLAMPSLIYAVISLLLPLAHNFSTLLGLGIIHGLLLGTFVPAALLIVFRNLPMKWWIVAIAIYSARVGFSLNSGIALVGFYVDQVGWQWMFWQDVLIAPLMGLCVYIGTPHEPVNRAVLVDADWGGMLLLGAGMAMLYAGLDQGNRLDWFGSGIVSALLGGGLLLAVGFFINEAVVKRPWAEVNVILSRNIGLALATILFYTLTALSNSSLVPNFLITVNQLRPEQSGSIFLIYAIGPMLIFLPISVYLMKYYDPRLTLLVGLAAFGAAAVLGTTLTHEWSTDDFIPMILLQSVGQSFCLLPLFLIALANSDPSRSTAFAAYVQVMRLVGTEAGIALMSTWLRIREQFHSNLLGRYINTGDPNVVGLLSKLTGLFTRHNAGTAQARGVGTLAGIVQREATTLGYIDGFWLTLLFALLGLACVAFMTASPPGPFSPKPR